MAKIKTKRIPKFKGKKIDAFYVSTAELAGSRECLARDQWCIDTFGGQRFDNNDQKNDGWWLQSEAELALFILRWGDKDAPV